MAFCAAALLALPVLAEPASSDLLDRAADLVERSREGAVRLTCIERVRSARYDERGEATRESRETFHWNLERDRSDRSIVAVRSKPGGRVVNGPDAEFAGIRWPDSHEWLGVLGWESRGWFRLDDAPPRHVQFRGAVPFDHGEDVREWEGRLELDPLTGRIVSLRASPSSQFERSVRRYDAFVTKTRWYITLFGGTIASGRFGRPPKVASAEVRFQLSAEGTVLPEEVRYETHRFVRRGVSEIERVQVRSYEDCRRVETTTGETPHPDRRPR